MSTLKKSKKFWRIQENPGSLLESGGILQDWGNRTENPEELIGNFGSQHRILTNPGESWEDSTESWKNPDIILVTPPTAARKVLRSLEEAEKTAKLSRIPENPERFLKHFERILTESL